MNKEIEIAEKEADQFAMELLMPEFMVKEMCHKYRLGLTNFRSLATIFGVPPLKMVKRLRQLGIS